MIATDGDVVLDACVSWVTYSPETRSESFFNILKHLRLDQCSQACMERVCARWHPLWLNYAEIQKMLDVQISTRPATSISAGASKLVVLLLGGLTESKELNRNVWKIDLASGKCKHISKKTHYAVKKSSVYCATPIGLFVIGGLCTIRDESFVRTTDCSLLTVPGMQYEQWPKAKHRLTETATICIRGHMYSFGGDSSHKAVSCLDLNTKVWSSCPDMPVGNANPIIAAIKDKVYFIFNTTSYNEKFKTANKVPMYCFDTSTHSWSELNPLYGALKSTSRAKAVTAGEELFIVGGWPKLCARYLPRNKKWKLLKQPGLVHCAFSMVYLEGKIILFGGYDRDIVCHKNIEV